MKPEDVACNTKVVYPSRAQAKKHLKVLRSRGRRQLLIYECRRCGYYHLGNPPGMQTYKRPGRPFE